MPPTVTKGLLITCDVATKQYLKFLDGKRPFILKDIDDTHFFIREDMYEYIKEEVVKNQDDVSYTKADFTA